MRNNIFYCIIGLLLAVPVWAECPAGKCNEFNSVVYPNTLGRVFDENAANDPNLKDCVVNNRKPLILNQDHQLFNQIKKIYPDKANGTLPIKVVLHENTPDCEITFVVIR